MPTFSVYNSLRPNKISPIEGDSPFVVEDVVLTPSLTNDSIKEYSNRISKKPILISRSEMKLLGSDINLVGYDPILSLSESLDKPFSPRLLNHVEFYTISGVNKTLFYTEVNSNLKVGDRVFIINGNYDSDLLIKENKYRKGRDGYKILLVDKCKIVLDIDYTGDDAYNDVEIDNFIKIYNIRSESEFIHANRQITTRGGNFDYKFNKYQNNICFIPPGNISTSLDWGKNDGVTGPGFFVKNGTQSWIDITTQLLSGSYSYALSPTYTNNDRVKIMNSDFTYNGKEYKEGFVYKWTVGPTNSEWVVDQTYSKPILTKGNFRDGNFKGTWNAGLFGQQNKQIKWEGGQSTWNMGTLLNTTWMSGTLKSLYTSSDSYFASFDDYGMPYQKVNAPNNSGRGYNFIIDSDINSSIIENGSFYKTIIGSQSGTYSITENEILGNTTYYSNNIKKAFFNDCSFFDSYLSESELKNTKSFNSKFYKSKSINSYFKNSVFKDSNYNSENIIKILAYDEFTASETQQTNSDIYQKVYKFYINRSSYERLRTGDSFYIKGLKINDNTKNVLNFFDKKFKINAWTEFVDNIGSKTGYEYSAFLLTPQDNTCKIKSNDTYTDIDGQNPNSIYYSIDIWVKRYSSVGNILSDNSFTNIIDITNAYIVDSDFESGLFENSDWNSGYHIEKNNDNNITMNDSIGGLYNLSIYNDPIRSRNILSATSSYNTSYPEGDLDKKGDILFLDSVDDMSSMTRLPDVYKVLESINGSLKLDSIESTLTISDGEFITNGAQNRYGHLKSLKINKSNIKSGLFRRSYITESLIQNTDYDQFDKDYNNMDKIKSLVISDSIFSDNSNILSFGTYLNSFFVKGSDTWHSGIIQESIWNGMTFSNGVIKESRWVDGTFKDGYFYNSKSFDSKPGSGNPYYYSENKKSYYKDGDITVNNNRSSWQNGTFLKGEFYKSDWEGGTFSNGNFYYSKWYDGNLLNGKIGSNQLSYDNTIFYNGTVSYAIVENADFKSQDISYYKNSNTNIVWLDGVFNGGKFRTLTGPSIWHNGIFNGGEFTTNARWKNGIFNGGKFTSTYGYTMSSSLTQSDYGWEYGEFNGGEFGNDSLTKNSTWYNGVFNDGVFKGRVWNNGVFMYGEFQGSGTTSVVGGSTCSNASIFTDSFTSSYYGYWRNGLFSNIKDRFVKDKKIYTLLTKYDSPVGPPKLAKFKNGLWVSGTFSHPSGEMINSVWLDGAFEKGKFNSSSFNPYVKRNGSSQSSFNLNDDTCYWDNGELNNSDFYISEWRNGKFIIGTATGMIWKNGISNYMNAFNIFWEAGTWRNGNWYGSSFEFNGQVTDDYTNQILHRGMSWSGTSSCHIWNIFDNTTDVERNVITSTASAISTTFGATGWVIDQEYYESTLVYDGQYYDRFGLGISRYY